MVDENPCLCSNNCLPFHFQAVFCPSLSYMICPGLVQCVPTPLANQIGPNMNTTPAQRYVRVGPYPSGCSSASATVRSWIHTPVWAVYMILGGIRDTMGNFLFLFFLFFLL